VQCRVSRLWQTVRVSGVGCGGCVAWWRDDSCARVVDGVDVSQEALGHGRACCFGNHTADEMLGRANWDGAGCVNLNRRDPGQ
jgi:hypothetical protein